MKTVGVEGLFSDFDRGFVSGPCHRLRSARRQNTLGSQIDGIDANPKGVGFSGISDRDLRYARVVWAIDPRVIKHRHQLWSSLGSRLRRDQISAVSVREANGMLRKTCRSSSGQ